VVLAEAATPGCRSSEAERDPCAYWEPKLNNAAQRLLAIHRLADAGCEGARPALAPLLDDPVAGAAALEALTKPGRDAVAEAAVLRALTRPALAARAAELAGRWRLDDARAPLLQGLAEERFVAARPAIVEALLALPPRADTAQGLASALDALHASEASADRDTPSAKLAVTLCDGLGGMLDALDAPAAAVVTSALARFAAHAPLTPDDAPGLAALRALRAAPPTARARAGQALVGAEGELDPRTRLTLLWGLTPSAAAGFALELLSDASCDEELALEASAVLALDGREAAARALAEPRAAPLPRAAIVPLALAAARGATGGLERRLREGHAGHRAAAAEALAALGLGPGADLHALEARLSREASPLLRAVPTGLWFQAAERLVGQGAGEDAGVHAAWANLPEMCDALTRDRLRAAAAAKEAADLVARRGPETTAPTPRAAAAARADLEARREARDGAFAEARRLAARVRAGEVRERAALLAMARSAEGGGPAAAPELWTKALETACRPLRWWAVSAALGSRGGTPPLGPSHRQGLERVDPGLAFVLALRLQASGE